MNLSGAPQRSGSVTELPRQSPPEGKESKKEEKGAPMTSWADEVDDDENNRARELERKREPSPKPVSQPKPEPRRVYIRQTKISDMPPPKVGFIQRVFSIALEFTSLYKQHASTNVLNFAAGTSGRSETTAGIFRTI